MTLINSRLIPEKRNVRLTVGKVNNHEANPLMVQAKPWEPRYDNLYANILYDEAANEYRCWYNPFIVHPPMTTAPPEKGRGTTISVDGTEFVICYATSPDGLTWTKPQLGLVEFEGSGANNIVLRGTCGAGVIDDTRETISQRRYKMLYGGN